MTLKVIQRKTNDLTFQLNLFLSFSECHLLHGAKVPLAQKVCDYYRIRPYVGRNLGKCPLVLIGESNYLPRETTCDTCSKKWYELDSLLQDQERGWVSPEYVLRDAANNDFKRPGHRIWRNCLEVISAQVKCDMHAAVEKIVALNFFIRPALYGRSLRRSLTCLDVEVAKENLNGVLRGFPSAHVVFLSSLAYKEWPDKNTPHVPHPSCSWWYRQIKSRENKSGHDLFRDIINDWIEKNNI